MKQDVSSTSSQGYPALLLNWENAIAVICLYSKANFSETDAC